MRVSSSQSGEFLGEADLPEGNMNFSNVRTRVLRRLHLHRSYTGIWIISRAPCQEARIVRAGRGTIFIWHDGGCLNKISPPETSRLNLPRNAADFTILAVSGSFFPRQLISRRRPVVKYRRFMIPGYRAIYAEEKSLFGRFSNRWRVDIVYRSRGTAKYELRAHF